MDSFDAYANKAVRAYEEYVERLNEKGDDVHKFYSAQNRYATEDGVHMRFKKDGTFSVAFIELKGRRYDIDAFPDCAVEVDKVQRLQQISAYEGCTVNLCAIYYNQRRMAFWRIDPNRIYQASELVCNRQTAGDDRKVRKLVVRFPLSESRQCSY